MDLEERQSAAMGGNLLAHGRTPIVDELKHGGTAGVGLPTYAQRSAFISTPGVQARQHHSAGPPWFQFGEMVSAPVLAGKSAKVPWIPPDPCVGLCLAAQPARATTTTATMTSSSSSCSISAPSPSPDAASIPSFPPPPPQPPPSKVGCNWGRIHSGLQSLARRPPARDVPCDWLQPASFCPLWTGLPWPCV